MRKGAGPPAELVCRAGGVLKVVRGLSLVCSGLENGLQGWGPVETGSCEIVDWGGVLVRCTLPRDRDWGLWGQRPEAPWSGTVCTGTKAQTGPRLEMRLGHSEGNRVRGSHGPVVASRAGNLMGRGQVLCHGARGGGRWALQAPKRQRPPVRGLESRGPQVLGRWNARGEAQEEGGPLGRQVR